MVRAGWYGREGQRRQRWWCYPKTGQRHRFTETLPRIVAEVAEAHCPECQTTLAAWEGQPAPRLYGFSAKHVALALTRVAQGATYRATAAEVRTLAGRELDTAPGTSGRGKKIAPANTHAQLVSDWVDVFAPVLWDALAPAEWPEEVLLDEKPLKYSVPGKPGGTTAFHVLGVMGYREVRPGDRRVYVAAVDAVPRVNMAAWKALLRSKPRQPQWVVTDGGGAVIGGARQAWRDAELWRCEWHLRDNLLQALPKPVRDDLQDPIRVALGSAQFSVGNWEAFTKLLRERASTEQGFNTALTIATNNGSLIRSQAASRDDNLPLSTGPLEQFFNTLGHRIGDRSANMTNRRRANALLKLLALDYNRWVNQDAWTDILREHLAKRRGLATHQRRHTDPRTAPSLR